MGKIDVGKVPVATGTGYPAIYAAPCKDRENQRLGLAADLTQFGVNKTRLKPGVWSSQRHWHGKEDEFVYVLEGEVVLVTDAGEQIMGPGDCAGFKAGVQDGHCFQNRSSRDAVILSVGSRDNADWCIYSDIDLQLKPGRYEGGGGYAKKDGTPF